MKELFFARCEAYKKLGDDTFLQLAEKDFFWQYNEESNSIAVIVKHMTGNMISRWTNFLNEDGEKPWRKRNEELINNFTTKEDVLKCWEKGWKCVFASIDEINKENLYQTIYIRGEGLSVADAFLRQLAHYSSHVGQIIYIAKMLRGHDWRTLSTPRNQSDDSMRDMHCKYDNNEQENTSPVCYAKSNEIREEYKD